MVADPAPSAAGSGKALRVYQVLIILGLGWVAGRLPDLFAQSTAEEARLQAALAGPDASAAAAGGTLSEQRIADIAAQVAAQVAGAAANETVARLIAAGWGPPGQQAGGGAALPPQIIVRAPAQPAPVIHVVNQPPGWTLPPGTMLAGTGTGTDAAPAGPASATASAAAASPAASRRAFQLATDGYAAMERGDRREGVALLSAAIAEDPKAPQAAQWTADVRQLTKRWSAEAYSLTRGAGNSDPLAASPVLGGGQAGATLAYAIDPLARRPVLLFGRLVAASGTTGALDPDTAEGAIGVRWKPVPGTALDVERRFALGPLARSTWSARASAGGIRTVRVGQRSVSAEFYGEGGVVGFARPDWYAGGQVRGGTPLYQSARIGLDAGAGAWGGWQQSGGTEAGRLDAGPSMRLQLKPFPFSAQLDYRWRTLGNAEPGTGPVLTIAGNF